MTRRLRLLILSYYYPPAGGPAVQRPEKLLRYLHPDVEATVIAAAIPDYEALSPLRLPLDSTRFCVEESVCRVPAGNPYRFWQALAKLRLYGSVRWCYIPDVARKWARAAVRLAQSLHADRPFDVIFSTAPPFSAALAGRDCARRLRLPWVCDLRDLWTGYLGGSWPSRMHYEYDLDLEKSVLSAATTIVMVTPGSRQWMLKNRLVPSEERIKCVTNGYDPADFKAALPSPEKFVIAHAGVFCGPESSGGGLRRFVRGQAYRPRRVMVDTASPIALVRAMEQLNDPRIEFRHMGPTDAENLRLFETSAVRDHIKVLGYYSHRDALAEMLASDAVYLCLTTTLDEPRNELVPQKLYEYLGARKPVLAPIQDGDAKDFLIQAGTGFCTTPDDVSPLACVLKNLAGCKFAARSLVAPREDFIRRFEWSRLADELLTIIDQAASVGRRVCVA